MTAGDHARGRVELVATRPLKNPSAPPTPFAIVCIATSPVSVSV